MHQASGASPPFPSLPQMLLEVLWAGFALLCFGVAFSGCCSPCSPGLPGLASYFTEGGGESRNFLDSGWEHEPWPSLALGEGILPPATKPRWSCLLPGPAFSLSQCDG